MRYKKYPLEFPERLQKRVSEYIISGFVKHTKSGAEPSPEDYEIHDILSDFLGQKREFNVFDRSEITDKIIMLG